MGKSLFKRVVHKCFELTIVFDIFRKILHKNFAVEKSVLRKELSFNKKTIDFGCGSGSYSELFTKEKYLGIDTEEKNIAFAKKRYNKEFSVINGKDLKSIKAKADQIFIIAVLHHIPDDILRTYICDFIRILGKKGSLLVIEPFPVKEQPRILGKFLLTFDRGKHIRKKEALIGFFMEMFALEKAYELYTGGCREYVLLLRKK